jgi:carbamoyl-phosphate synthase small subunit
LKHAALLALADGSLFYGESIGIAGQRVAEVVFNTAMTGYQEILTDPSYAQQIVTLTYPHIGNVGVNPDDEESQGVFAAGLVIRDLPILESNWRSTESLASYLARNQVVSIAGIDTRRLTRLLREKGAQNGCLVAGENIDVEAAIQAAKDFAGLQGMDLAKQVSTKETYVWQSDAAKYNVIAYDFGVKRNILKMLAERGCRVTVVPAQTPASEVLKQNPDGVFLSNGPGDPEPCDYAIAAIQQILAANIPVFGICLGHQLLGLANGAKTTKMKFGHHGANHPVQDLASTRVMITSQNHGFAIDESSLPSNLKATHRSLFDGSLQGIKLVDKPAFSFQGHPEASPGPHDVAPLFDQFVELMK